MNAAALVLEAEEGGAAPYPPREGCKVTPLIEAAEMYPALERAMLDAERSVWLAFRIFDPLTRLRSDEARALGLGTWLDLIEHCAHRGVGVRVLLTDFEPVMAHALHAGSWSSFNALQKRFAGLPEAERKRFQMMVIQHEGEVGWGWRQLLRVGLRFRIRRLVTELIDTITDEDDPIAARPGIWRYLHWEEDRPHRWRPGPPPRLWPATYHQKCAIVDASKAFVGGLDINERRFDDADHDQRADRTWHDISALIEGPVASDAARHFAQLWNRELPRFREIVGQWTDGSTRELTLDPLEAADEAAIADAPAAGGATVQLARTLSRASARAFAFGPIPDIRELREAYRRLFGAARRRLYIETQFFRAIEAADWLIAALRANPELEIIILVANVPEEIAFEGAGGNPAHRHGEYLQARALSRLLRAGGLDRVGLFTLAKQEAVRRSERRFARRRGTAFGSGLIHIHAKLVIADDDACLISSANINGRSLQWDTELGFIWSGDATIAAFRDDLWSQLSAGELDGSATLADWRSAAEFNRTAEPDDRRGFVVPYQRSRAARFGVPHWWVPDSFV
ncbi:MAG: hypothetical protein H7X93_08535 [Sphingomonadaceae bacterium]|nr:hypothetical protein [Sphingomonadaceae bacterium]